MHTNIIVRAGGRNNAHNHHLKHPAIASEERAMIYTTDLLFPLQAVHTLYKQYLQSIGTY